MKARKTKLTCGPSRMKNSGSLSRFGVKSGMSTGRLSTIPSVVIPSEKYSLNMSLREIRICAIDCMKKEKE
jgi:hypothetical protein